MKYLKRFNEEFFFPEDFKNPSEKEGTFDFFMKKTKEELIDYQKNFKHDFENPAEHDPNYVAWKKVCDIKHCFDREPFSYSRKESEFPSKTL